MSKKKLRGKGKKDERLQAQQQTIDEQAAEIEKLRAQLAGKAEQSESESNAFTGAPGKVRRRQVRARAYDMYVAMGGKTIEQQLRNIHHRSRAYSSQLKASEKGMHEGGWGENVTHYEDRMSGSLLARLIKEKTKLMDICLSEAQTDADECEELGADFEQDASEQKPEPATDAPRLKFTDEEKAEVIKWVKAGAKGEEPPLAAEVGRALDWCLENPLHMPEDLVQLMMTVQAINAEREQMAKGDQWYAPAPEAAKA